MLHKTRNSVVTLAILLSLVGVSKPAKAFLLAQSNVAQKTFTVPDELPQDATVKITTSNSTKSIAQSLKEGFGGKYPKAEVSIETQNSSEVLNSLSQGKADLVAIGRDLTPAEEDRGFVSVPISREKIAIVVSKNNAYDGNLTIDQFAQIFRGEITDWSELGRATPGRIKLVDALDTNDTRQAFPNYPVFQKAEFIAGADAFKLDRDSTDAMIAELDNNAMGYAVANDVINRDDIKIVTMHQTLPDDQRYPFSQPFNLVYKGTPSEAAQAYLGFAAGEGGEQVVANRVGSVGAVVAAAGVASGLAGNSNGQPDNTKADVNADGTAPDADAKADGDVNADRTAPGADAKADGDVNADRTAPGADANADGDAEADANLDSDRDKIIADTKGANTNQNKSGEFNPDIEGSGEVNPDVAGSGEVNPDVEGSGEVNPDVEGSGEVNPDVEGSGEVNPDVEGSGEPLSVEEGENASGEVATAKKGKWWWWLPLILGIPILAALFAFGGRKKSDQEPAIDNFPNDPNRGSGTSGTPGDGDIPPVGANVSGNVGSVSDNTVKTTSNLGGATLATGGAALASGAAAANLAGKQRSVDNDSDIDLDLSSDESDSVDEIPSNPVSEFTGQETNLQLGDQSTKLQVDEDLETTDSRLNDLPSQDRGTIAGGAAALGGVAAAGFRSDADTSRNEIVDDAVAGNEIADDIAPDTKISTDTSSRETSDRVDFSTSALDDTSSEGLVETDQDSGRNPNGEFRGDFVLQEEVKETSSTADTDYGMDLDLTEPADDAALDRESSTATSELDISEQNTEISPGSDISDQATQTGGAAMAGGAAALGGAAAASGFFNRDRTELEERDTQINSQSDSDIDIDLNQLETAEEQSINNELDRPELDTEFNPVSEINQTTQRETTSADLIDRSESFEAPADGEFTSEDSNTEDTGIIDRATQTGGTAMAGGAAALGGAAAASGFFDRQTDDTAVDAEFTSEQDTAIDVPEFDTDLNLDRAETRDRDLGENLTTPEMDLSLDDPEVGEATSSRFSDRDRDSEPSSNFQRLDDFELSSETTGNSGNSLEELTFENAAEAENLSLSEITFDNADEDTNVVDASLEEITFEDAVEAESLSLDGITSDDANSIDASLEEITFENTAEPDLRLNEITLEDVRANSTSDLADETSSTANNQDINLNDLGFEENAPSSSSNLLDDNQVDTTNLSDDQSNDMNNISEWLDSLETPRKGTDNISQWLDTLDVDNNDSTNIDTTIDKSNDMTEESDDISFQFLEDLLDRDSDGNRNNQ